MMKKNITIAAAVMAFVISCSGKGKPDPYVPAYDYGNKEETDAAVEPWIDPDAPEKPEYLCNGRIQIGVDMERGGSVFHFSEAGKKQNLLNRADEGRFIQQSYYGYDDGSSWNGTPWVWNPVQGGCWDGSVKGKVIYSSKESNKLTIKSIPVLWSTCRAADDCLFTEVISLNGDVARIKFSMSYTGETSGQNRHQELPAVFVDWDLSTFWCYTGSKPWTDDQALTSYVPKNLETSGNSYQKYTEEWAAFIGSDGKGIGVYSPVTGQCTLYRFGSGPGGSKAGSCSYFAPIKAMTITSGFTFSYDVYVTFGTVQEIRSRFKAIHDAKR